MAPRKARIEVNNAVFSLPYHVAKEEGYFAEEGYDVELVPAGTPAAIVNRLNEEMRKSLARPETKSRLTALGAVTVGDTPAQFLEFLRKDHERWTRVIKTAGVKAE